MKPPQLNSYSWHLGWLFRIYLLEINLQETEKICHLRRRRNIRKQSTDVVDKMKIDEDWKPHYQCRTRFLIDVIPLLYVNLVHKSIVSSFTISMCLYVFKCLNEFIYMYVYVCYNINFYIRFEKSLLRKQMWVRF